MATNETSSELLVSWPNITGLLAHGGHITVGRVAHIEGAAIAADEHSVFATIVRRRDESFEELLGRLDHAVGLALCEGIHTNEIEGGHFEVATPRDPKRKSDA